MSSLEIVTRWLDVRSGELRKVLFSFLGAYSVLAFLVLSKALRNALYVTTFDVTTLPYMTIAVAVLTLPTVALFGRAMGSGGPHRVYNGLVVILAATMVVTYAISGISPQVAVLSFYLLTVLGTSLLTSGFWIVTAEQFSLRQAKRLFGVIGAGGTLGAMVTGLAVGPLTRRFSAYELVPGLVLLLVSALVFQRCMPKMAPHHHHETAPPETPLREGFTLIARSAHLRMIAGVVFVAAMVSTVLDYQFIEVVSSTYQNSDEMAGFFAAFYGWTGVLSLFLQVFVVAQLMSRAGIAASLSILPGLLFAGSAAMLLVPSSLYFWAATGTRGVDNSLRKSLHRSVLEYLYVPVSPEVRRKTKTFIDSVVDSTAGGVAAAILFVWVTWAGLPARYLSLLIVAMALAFIYMAVKAGRVYRETVQSRLTYGDESLDTSGFDSRQLLTTTLSNVDLQAELAKAGIENPAIAASSARPRSGKDSDTTLDRLRSTDVDVVRRALSECDDWDETHVAALTRLLARTDLYESAVMALLQVGPAAIEYLIATMLDEHADFVIRRRIPRVLSEVDSVEADQALLDALSVGRFEVRYRAAIALSRRRKAGLPLSRGDWEAAIWHSVEREVGRDRPIWELQKIFDGSEAGDDDFVNERLDVRGELSLEHTFRQLSLVLDAGAVKMAFHGVVTEDEQLKSLALEYLEHALPPRVKERLWPFIGDISDYQRKRSLRSVDEIVGELSQTGATLFGDATERAALDEALRTHRRDQKKNDDEDN